jgi:hypothetical protein
MRITITVTRSIAIFEFFLEKIKFFSIVLLSFQNLVVREMQSAVVQNVSNDRSGKCFRQERCVVAVMKKNSRYLRDSVPSRSATTTLSVPSGA